MTLPATTQAGIRQDNLQSATDGGRVVWVTYKTVWEAPVIGFQNTPPGTATAGDTYIVRAPAVAAWAGQENNIAQRNADNTAWDFTPPVSGETRKLPTATGGTTEYTYDGSQWRNARPPIRHADVNTIAERDALDAVPRDIVRVTATGLDYEYDGLGWIEVQEGVDQFGTPDTFAITAANIGSGRLGPVTGTPTDENQIFVYNKSGGSYLTPNDDFDYDAPNKEVVLKGVILGAVVVGDEFVCSYLA